MFFSRWLIHEWLTYSVIYKLLVCHHCWQKHFFVFMQKHKMWNGTWNTVHVLGNGASVKVSGEWTAVSKKFHVLFCVHVCLCVCVCACTMCHWFLSSCCLLFLSTFPPLTPQFDPSLGLMTSITPINPTMPSLDLPGTHHPGCSSCQGDGPPLFPPNTSITVVNSAAVTDTAGVRELHPCLFIDQERVLSVNYPYPHANLSFRIHIRAPFSQILCSNNDIPQ